MIQVTYKKKGISITQAWFGSKEELLPVKTDICFFHGISESGTDKNSISTAFHTLISDLRLSEDELLAKINKNVRYEIRRSCKEEVEYRFFSAEALKEKPEIIRQFGEMYELMYREKGQKASFNYNQFDAYKEKNAILLTAIYEKDRPLVFHSYILEEKQARLLHSVSDFRSAEADANLVARANKRLHWEDMLLLRQKGVESYDWGGVSSLDNPNGIDSFKFKFGGEPLTYYNVYMGKSLLGRLAVWLLRIKKGR